MSKQAWVECVSSLQAAGPSVVGTAAATILNPQAKFTFPAGFFDVIGKVIRVKGAGQITTAASSPGTLTLDLRLGGTVIFNGAASATLQVSKTNVPIWWEIDLTLRTVGSSANFMGQGMWGSDALNATSGLVLPMPNTAPAVGNNFDATTSQQLDHFATLGSASDTLILQQYSVEVLN